jgi:SAM-dependent methyltransferase
MQATVDGGVVSAPAASWKDIDRVAWDELAERHGVPMKPQKLEAALKRLRRDRLEHNKRTLRGGRGPRRTTEVVGDLYEHLYAESNAEFVAGRARRRDVFLVDGAPVAVNGWFTYAYRLELLDRALQRCGGDSVLEVGAGRGSLVALLALRQPERRFCGLELTAAGVARAEELRVDLPTELVELSARTDVPSPGEALASTTFVQGDATALPFEDGSFDVSYTCLALEQMPHLATSAIRELARVTRRYCVFLEPFAEANGPIALAELRAADYFRDRYRRVRKLGLEPVYFSKRMPQKIRFNTGLLVARVAT